MLREGESVSPGTSFLRGFLTPSGQSCPLNGASVMYIARYVDIYECMYPYVIIYIDNVDICECRHAYVIKEGDRKLRGSVEI